MQCVWIVSQNEWEQQTHPQTPLLQVPWSQQEDRRPDLRQLQHQHHHPVEEEQGGGSCLQCMWSLLQGAWEGETHRTEERQHPDQEEEAEQEQDCVALHLQHLHLSRHRKLEQQLR